jgi:hypothetical protein
VLLEDVRASLVAVAVHALFLKDRVLEQALRLLEELRRQQQFRSVPHQAVAHSRLAPG